VVNRLSRKLAKWSNITLLMWMMMLV